MSTSKAEPSATQHPIRRSTGTVSPSKPKPKSGGAITRTATHASPTAAAAVASA
jgi:hypothetical protein